MKIEVFVGENHTVYTQEELVNYLMEDENLIAEIKRDFFHDEINEDALFSALINKNEAQRELIEGLWENFLFEELIKIIEEQYWHNTIDI